MSELIASYPYATSTLKKDFEFRDISQIQNCVQAQLKFSKNDHLRVYAYITYIIRIGKGFENKNK